MKRVALFPSAFHPSLGGVEELTGQLALHLKEKGVRPLICTNRWPRSLPEIDVWKGISVRRLPFRMPEGGIKSWTSFNLTQSGVFKSLVSILLRFEVDLVHVQCVSSNAWYAASAAECLGVPLVVSAQGERTMDAGGLYQRSPLYNRILRSTLEHADFITACSAATLRDLREYNGRSFACPSEVIYNGVGAESFVAVPPWPHPRPYILGLGRLVPQKGFFGLLRAYACAGLQDTDLIIAGDGTEAEALEKEAGLLGISGRVLFPGRAVRQTVRELIAGARGVVIPSLREPMGIVALEGMAAGKPLVVSSVDGLKEVAAPGAWCRHHSPGNVEELSAGLRWLEGIHHSRPLECMRERAMRFLWPVITDQYLEAYREASGVGSVNAEEPLS